MRYLALTVLICASFSSPARAQAADPAITAPINAFLAAFNKGDVAGAAATHAADADLVIIDEAAPYAWHGPKAVQAWATDLAAADARAGVTNQQVKLGAVTRIESDGTAAYVVVPSVYTFTEKGVAMRANAQMTFHLTKGPSGWLIHGWTWTGPKASKVAVTAR
jgi:ketosteroid isomerase-like protein